MSDTLPRIQALAATGAVLISRHGYRELAADDLAPDEIVAGVASAIVVEDYPNAERGRACSFSRRTRVANRFTRYGGYLSAQPLQPCW